MIGSFNLISKLPLLVFAIFVFVVFVSFIWAGIVLLSARGDPDKTQKGRRILLTALCGFFITLIVIFIFYSLSYFLKKSGVPQPEEASGEFPISPAINFPPPPQFINIGNYYFNGPWLLENYNQIEKSAIYLILCKKNENYDIIFIENTTRSQILRHAQYNCWKEKCGKKISNLYIAVFWTTSKKYNSEEIRRIKDELENQINPPCSVPNNPVVKL